MDDGNILVICLYLLHTLFVMHSRDARVVLYSLPFREDLWGLSPTARAGISVF